MVGRGTTRTARPALPMPPPVPEDQVEEPPPPDTSAVEDPSEIEEDPPPTDSDHAEELARVREALDDARRTIAALQRISSTPTPIVQPREPKVNKPTPFGGKLPEYATFISQCILTFTLCPSSYQKDEQKVLFVISYLEGTARKWASPILENERHPLRQDFPAFKTALDDIYADRNLRQRAEDKLTNLKQTKSAASYAAEFLEITAPLELGENGQHTLFYRGLKTDIKKALVFLPEAENFQKFVQQCISLDQRLFYVKREEEMAAKSSRSSSSKPQDNNSKSSKNHSNDSKKAQGSATSRSQPDSHPPSKRQQQSNPSPRAPSEEER